MDLVAIDAGHNHDKPSNTVGGNTEGKVLYWYDPMRPEKHFDKPGKSPFMDMQLVPKYAEGSSGEGYGSSPVISLNNENIQKMGVRTEKVQSSEFGQGIRATGIIIANERTKVDIYSQVEGRVEDLQHSAVFDKVTKGDMFYNLVSPELTSLQNDYIASSKAGLKDVAAASLNRMKLLGVDGRVIDTIKKTGKAYEKVPFYIPANGVLSTIEIRNGSYIKANDKAASIQDLSTIWVEAAISEKDMSAIKEGDSAQISISGSTESCPAKVDYIYPNINTDTRTGKVRLVVDNKDGQLKPSGYASVEFATALSVRMNIPSEAILRDSTGNHVIVSLGDGKFQARKIETGITGGGRTEVLSGLKEGDSVVVNGQFLIDSESSLRESLNKLDTSQDKPENNKGMKNMEMPNDK
jgi:Cu(I)/Ag(I) efflux system membrane fusion protein